MRDIQSEKPEIPKGVDKVGIRELYLPYKVWMKGGGTHNTVANISAYVTLTSHFKGINMSRIPEILHKRIDQAISSDYIDLVLRDLCKTLEAPSSYLKVRFSYFMKKKSPVKGVEGYVYYPCIFEGKLEKGEFKHFLTVEVFYTSLCECSKEISDYGAHNQRSLAKITVMYNKDKQVWIEDLIDLVEKHASCSIYPILKREDEKWVTERAYERPRFVETMARRVAQDLEKDERVLGFVAVFNHFESIHQYNAVSVIHGGEVYLP